MAEIPKTSVSLLTVLANDTTNARWFEFYNAYEGPMRAFLASKYPALEADDIVQVHGEHGCSEQEDCKEYLSFHHR